MEHRVFWFLRVGKAGKMLHPYLILLLLFHSAAVFAQSGQKGGQNWGLGPVQLDDQFPLALFHAGLKADTPEVLPKGQSSFRSSFAWSNTDNVKKSSYQVDAEVRSATFAYSLGVFDNFQVGLEIPIIVSFRQGCMKP